MGGSRKHVPQIVLPRGLVGRITFIMMTRMHGPLYENAARALQLQPDDDLLELACGNGYFLKRYASVAHSIAGLDYSPLAIKLATDRNKTRVSAGTAKFVQANASRLPWAAESFSVATTMGSFTVFPEPLETLREMHRVLRPGGRAVIVLEWNAEDGQDHSKYAAKWGMRLWSESEARAAMGQAGFSEVSITYAAGSGFPKIMIIRGLKL